MTINSLRFRLLATTALLVVVILPLTAIILTSYYRHEAERAIDIQLKVHLGNLIAVSLRQSHDEKSGEKAKSIDLGYPLFRRPFSGWYWQIGLPPGREGGERRYAVSDSLLDERLPQIADSSGEHGELLAYVNGPDGQILRMMQKTIFVGGEREGEKGQPYVYGVAIDARELDQQVARFRNLLLVALGVLGLGLVLAGLAQVRYGLAPLKIISRRLNEIRAGQASLLSGDFPEEIEPLQRELNALIKSNRDVVERARTHVGNLAHALKTPLSVISNEISRLRENKACRGNEDFDASARNIERQARLMGDQIRHHLDRARMAARSGIIGNATPLAPVARSLGRTLAKIYRQRHIDLEIDCPEGLIFRGEKQDIEEMLGNLLDNAFKYSASQVRLEAVPDPQGKDFVRIRVEDDGPGLSRSQRRKAMQRGQRLDEKTPGSGLGLSIVTDLAHLYGGSLHLSRSPLGGLQAELSLPLASGG